MEDRTVIRAALRFAVAYARERERIMRACNTVSSEAELAAMRRAMQKTNWCDAAWLAEYRRRRRERTTTSAEVSEA